MKRKYRIRKHVCNHTITRYGHPFTYYSIEYNYLTIFGIEFWKRITDFEPISDDDTFSSLSEAKDVITKFANYKKHLDHDDEIVETVEI
jgi:hypothetical protein